MDDNRSSLKDQIYKTVLESIFSYDYKPGDIINERDLIARCGCSKSPVREALVSLCNDNVLRNIPRYGYEVVRLTREDVEDMIHLRYLIEGALLKEHATQFSQGQILKLEQLNQACSDTSVDLWTHWDANARFHLQLTAFCNNGYAYQTLEQMMARLKRAYAQFYWDRWGESATRSWDTKNHEMMLAHIREKNIPALLGSLRLDLQDFGSLSCVVPDYFSPADNQSVIAT